MLHFLGRCGSTLLCQIFNRLPNTLVFSDPFIHSYITTAYHYNKLTYKQCTQLVRSTQRLLLKPKNKVKRTESTCFFFYNFLKLFYREIMIELCLRVLLHMPDFGQKHRLLFLISNTFSTSDILLLA